MNSRPCRAYHGAGAEVAPCATRGHYESPWRYGPLGSAHCWGCSLTLTAERGPHGRTAERGAERRTDQANMAISLRNGCKCGPILALSVHFDG